MAFTIDHPEAGASKAARYAHLSSQVKALLEGERDFIANAANAASLVFHLLPAVNWAGFYIARKEELVLGPFQGKPACVRIPFGKGVCGTAARQLRTLVVQDVQKFPGHIACDAASRSEIVVPVKAARRLIAVLDLDSPVAGRFDEEDRAGLEALVEVFKAATDLPGE